MIEFYEDEFPVTNLTSDHCRNQYANHTDLLLGSHLYDFCSVTFDSVLCWPPTPVNKTATIKCFSELFTIKYDDTRKYST